jgi:hypothetical protein
MRISRDALRGYILEEVLAFLIQNTGYRLLVDEAQDPQELGWRGNGLVVHGRGAEHQVDVLGELRWIPAFTYPLRLFVEAKFRKSRTGIGPVRNLISVLLDVNQNNLPRIDRQGGRIPQLRPKYHYVGAIFSTSGFSRPATDMALAHGVSLIDLGSSEFAPLLEAVSAAAEALVEMNEQTLDVPRYEGEPEESEASGTSASKQLLALRTALREALRTQTHPSKPPAYGLSRDLLPGLSPAIQAAREMGELFVGMSRGPYMLVLKADDQDDFLSYCAEHPTHDIWISWDTEHDEGRTWNIRPNSHRRAYRLTFRLPEVVADAIFSSENVLRAALDLKRSHLSEIMIYRHEDRQDSLIRLRFRPEEISRD